MEVSHDMGYIFNARIGLRQGNVTLYDQQD
jgi:hypothetical protein